MTLGPKAFVCTDFEERCVRRLIYEEVSHIEGEIVLLAAALSDFRISARCDQVIETSEYKLGTSEYKQADAS